MGFLKVKVLLDSVLPDVRDSLRFLCHLASADAGLSEAFIPDLPSQGQLGQFRAPSADCQPNTKTGTAGHADLALFRQAGGAETTALGNTKSAWSPTARAPKA